MSDIDHPLKLYNSLTREVEQFVPDDPTRVTMYNCGPTVYSYAHIGNARAAVVADVLFRVLMHIYDPEQLAALNKGETYPSEEAKVLYARNITDVDDKIIAAAKETGVPITEITEKYARIYNEDLAALNCLPPTYQPKATDHIADMVNLIQNLIDNGHAYVSDGHVFFDVSTYDGYGSLSGNTMENLRGGDRVGEGEVARKRNSADFVLWKPELDGVGWDTPFGPGGSNMRGRPGWHIECSAMIKAKLGETIDIHCGGIDLKFPHHENEIAQSCCGNGTDEFARFWVHNEFLNMGKDKMSKSLGNVTLVHDLLEDWDGEVIRLALLKAHYRSELSWSEDLLRESKAQLDGWYRHFQTTKYNFALLEPRVSNALLKDLNLQGMFVFLGDLFGALTHFNDELDEKLDLTSFKYGNRIEFQFESVVDVFSTFKYNANLLGLLQRDPDDWFAGNASDDDKARFDALAVARHAARQAKDWSEADRIRDESKALGIVFEDGKDGTTWRKA